MLDVDAIDTYYGPSHILHDVSLEVYEGEILTLVGRNGAGKSTTIRSVMGLTPPKDGSVTFRGERIEGRSPHEIRKLGISWVPEDRRVFPTLTVAENLRLAASSGDGDAREQFAAVYERFPRLDERRTQNAGTLSGGEQQMLAIARALVGAETDLLLLDEPSEGLAPQIVDDVADAIRELNEDGVTVLLVEQNAEMALELAERAYVIDSGAIEFEGTARQLRENRGLMEEYLGVK